MKTCFKTDRIRFLLPLIALSLLVLAGGGCSTTMKVSKVDPKTGHFPTTTQLSPGDIKEEKTLDVFEFRQLLYIRSAASPRDEFRDFLKESLVNLEFFESVKDRREMEAFVVGKGLSDSVGNVTDMIGLNRLQKQIGNFMVADYSVQWDGSYWYTFDIALVNPSDGQTVFHATHRAFNWAGLDKPLFYPVLNAVKDWIEQNKR
ncbi:MAG TPA: hypothetical protein PKA41_18555 [Verrucomicrobiota bacterium]|nr:hypothetical protein [Verrucomicrobiota bacterium]